MKSEKRDSNPQPSPWQGDILPLNYFRNIGKLQELNNKLIVLKLFVFE